MKPTTQLPPVQSNDGAAHVPAWLYVPVILAVVYFFWRGPINAMDDNGDFDVNYVATRVWLEGGNPYIQKNLHDVYMETAVPGQRAPNPRWLVALYPPSFYPTMIPLVWMDRETAGQAVIALNLAMSILLLWMLPTVTGLGNNPTATTVLRIAVLILAPLHTTFNLGQTSLIVLVCLIGAVWYERKQFRGHWAVAGALLGIATAVKVNLALPFIAFELCRGRWRSSVTALAVAAVFFGIGVLPLQLNHPNWLHDFRSTMDALLRDGGFGDPAHLNPHRHHLINLQYALHTLTDHRAVVSMITAAFVLTLAVLTIWLLRRRRDTSGELLGLSMVSVLALLLTYHRFYDAVVLVFPIAWAIRFLTPLPSGGRGWVRGESHLNTGDDFFSTAVSPAPLTPSLSPRRGEGTGIALITLLFTAVFFVPGAVILGNKKINRDYIPPSLHQSDFWNVLVMPHQVWALVALAAVLLVALIKAHGAAPSLADRSLDGR